MTSAALLLGSVEAAEELNGDLAPSLEYSGINREQIVSGEGYLPLHQVVMFLNHAAEHLQCDSFGLLVAKHQPPARFAMIGQLIRFCPTLGEAIEDGITFSILNSQYSDWELHPLQGSVSLVRQVRTNLDLSLHQIQTLALALTYKAMNGICQRRIALTQVTFSHSPPQQPERAKQFFGAPILYDQPFASLVIPEDELSSAIPTADANVYQLLKSHLQDLIQASDAEPTLEQRLRRELRQTVGSHRCTLGAIAQNWGVHERELQRRLKASGTSFRLLLNDVRQELAEQYLRNSSISVLELSDMLGYSNASAFSRAFKASAGISPDHWRAQKQQILS